jgi:hypothetical protein
MYSMLSHYIIVEIQKKLRFRFINSLLLSSQCSNGTVKCDEPATPSTGEFQLNIFLEEKGTYSLLLWQKPSVYHSPPCQCP